MNTVEIKTIEMICPVCHRVYTIHDTVKHVVKCLVCKDQPKLITTAS